MRLYIVLLFLLIAFAYQAQNVGINKIDPQTSLDVSGTATISRISSSLNPTVDLKDIGDGFSRLRFSRVDQVSDNYWLLAGRAVEGGDENSRFNLFYNGDDFTGNLVIIKGDGQIGFGTTPTDRLHIRSNTLEDALRIQIGEETKMRVLSNGGTTFGLNNTNGTPQDGIYVHGNSGLGISNPDDKLEVNGDVNITGQIKADDQIGLPGQILTPNQNGGMNWIDPRGYDYFIDFWKTGSSDWTVPADVTEVMVEMWGAGGGGALGGGGGSGGYIKAIFSVTPGQVLTTFIGVGGAGVSNGMAVSAADGQSTSISSGGFSIVANGGQGASQTEPGIGGTFTHSTIISRLSRKGEKGGRNISLPIYSGYAKIDYGKGGCAPFSDNTGGEGEIWYRQNGVVPYTRIDGTAGIQPGGGGGGGNTSNNFGGNGYIIIRW